MKTSPGAFSVRATFVLLLLGGAMIGPSLACSVAPAGEAPPTATSRPRIGDAVGDLKFTDIRYLTRSLRDLGDRRVVVLVFTNTACHIEYS